MADAFIHGVQAHGDEGVIWMLNGEPQVAADCEVACMVGVKSRELFRANWRAGVHTVLLDKGYNRGKASGPVRGWEYWRVAVDAHHPTAHLMSVNHPSDRAEKLEIDLQPWREAGDHILIAGSSAKYHAFYGLKEPTTFVKDVVRELRAITDRPIVYRPKPSWRDAVQLRKARYSGASESIADVLANAWATVTHGSNACFESVVAGVPCIILGEGVAKPLSSTSVQDINAPRLASEADRLQWINNLSYRQWTQAEMYSGEAWATIRGQIYA
ncbi:MAG: hypothetical protein ACYCZ0_00085 [Minisyncoccota bacterium]